MTPDRIDAELLHLLDIDSRLDSLPLPQDDDTWITDLDRIALDSVSYAHHRDAARRNLRLMADKLLAACPSIPDEQLAHLTAIRNRIGRPHLNPND